MSLIFYYLWGIRILTIAHPERFGREAAGARGASGSNERCSATLESFFGNQKKRSHQRCDLFFWFAGAFSARRCGELSVRFAHSTRKTPLNGFLSHYLPVSRHYVSCLLSEASDPVPYSWLADRIRTLTLSIRVRGRFVWHLSDFGSRARVSAAHAEAICTSSTADVAELSAFFPLDGAAFPAVLSAEPSSAVSEGNWSHRPCSKLSVLFFSPIPI